MKRLLGDFTEMKEEDSDDELKETEGVEERAIEQIDKGIKNKRERWVALEQEWEDTESRIRNPPPLSVPFLLFIFYTCMKFVICYRY